METALAHARVPEPSIDQELAGIDPYDDRTLAPFRFQRDAEVTPIFVRCGSSSGTDRLAAHRR
jgi:hypothetical protein